MNSEVNEIKPAKSGGPARRDKKRHPAECYSSVLRDVFALRSSRRPYSLRAFARDLGLSHTYLSLILNGKKPLPLPTLKSLSDKLGLDETQRRELEALEPRSRSNGKRDPFSRLEMAKFRLIARWYYIALLDVLEIEDGATSPTRIADYLGVDREQVKDALNTLKQLGIIRLNGKRWEKVDKKLSILLPTSKEEIRAYHRQMILQALDELEKTTEPEFKLRDITGMTLPINPRRLPGARKKIAKFRRSLERYLTQGKCTEVYQLNVQLFPLRNAGKSKRNEKV